MDLTHPPLGRLRRFYDQLLAGDADGLLALYAGAPRIDTPLHGEVGGEEEFRRFIRQQQAWLAERSAAPQLSNEIRTGERVVQEWVLDLALDGRTIDLPVALVADLKDETVSAIRIYHSTWPLNGRHRVRPPLIAPVEDLEEPEVIQAYMKGLAEADLEAVLGLFAADGYAREPSGERFRYDGPEGLRRFYGAALGAGGIKLKHCSATFDGRCCAVEFIAVEWAGVTLPPQAGAAVYEVSGPEKLRAARIYDDVEPPLNEIS